MRVALLACERRRQKRIREWRGEPPDDETLTKIWQRVPLAEVATVMEMWFHDFELYMLLGEMLSILSILSILASDP